MVNVFVGARVDEERIWISIVWGGSRSLERGRHMKLSDWSFGSQQYALNIKTAVFFKPEYILQRSYHVQAVGNSNYSTIQLIRKLSVLD